MCSVTNNASIHQLLIECFWKTFILLLKVKNFSDKIIDSVFNNYSTEITFFENDSLTITLHGQIYFGRYELTSNKLKTEFFNSKNEWESLIYMRWPKKTLHPNPKGEHFNLRLLEVLNVLNQTEEILLSNAFVSFKRM